MPSSYKQKQFHFLNRQHGEPSRSRKVMRHENEFLRLFICISLKNGSNLGNDLLQFVNRRTVKDETQPR